eukprot:CAMPEP_0198146980 /NCGR_PEP_ID=MMETSP1443-20131203/32581_1 /TAXON_ID=186043 /ORGANISM="Entomoneis sp., Strain CCMP2396" /LENGTH=783 /DNA_ID=CAMNT_0043811099 /DNA_START=106 /DNA_END=2454 /DNA_ORIENTATION=-
MDRNLLGRATEGTEAPTPGYLYVDLTKAATANPTACAEMAQYLTRKLQNKQNPNVKTKCCKVIAKLSEQVPRNQFRRCIAQNAGAVAAIKEAINFRGPMDPLQGDAKNEKVRAAAREALEAVYKEAPSSEAPTGAPMHSISASYGSAPHAGGGYGGGGGGAGYGGDAGGSRAMEGIGNPTYSDARNDPRYNGTAPNNFVDAMKEAGEVVRGMIQDPLARNIGPNTPHQGHSGNLPGYGSNRQSGSYGGPPPGSAELSAATDGQWNMASNRGPNAVTGGPASTEYYKERDTSFNQLSSTHNGGAHATSASAGTVGGSWGSGSVASQARASAYGTPSVTINHNPSAGGAGGTTAGATMSDGTYEKNLVLELCPPGGLKPVPPPDKLSSFARAVGSLNPDLICPVLLDFLEDGQPWVIRAKALCVMETSIQNGIGADGTNPYKTFFHACAAEIQPLAVHPRPAIKDPARRVLLILGVTPGPGPDAPPSTTSRVAVPPSAAPAPNLLDFDDAPPVPPSAPPPLPPTEAPPPPPAAPAGPSSSMFGGMTIKGSKSFETPAAPAAAPPVSAAPPADNLLDFTSSDTFSAAVTADPFADAPVAEASNPAAASSMFGNLSVKDSKREDEPVEILADVVAPTSSGSAFGFMNVNPAQPPAAAPPASAPTLAAAQAPATPVVAQPMFDPLKSTGMASMAGMAMPTGASPPYQQKMMAMSQEQMQAMAYQQMMMQQQMQMQMAMSRGGGYNGGMSMPQPTMPVQFRTSSSGSMSMGGGRGVAPAKKDDRKFDFV